MRIRSICTIATVLALAGAIGVSSAIAQADDLKATIPFDFYAAGKLFPAGTYRVSQESPGTLRLHQDEGKKSAYLMVAARETARGSKDQSWLVFHQYGNMSFFAGAYWSGSSASLTVPVSRTEQQIAKNQGQPNPVTLAAK